MEDERRSMFVHFLWVLWFPRMRGVSVRVKYSPGILLPTNENIDRMGFYKSYYIGIRAVFSTNFFGMLPFNRIKSKIDVTPDL